MKYSVRLPLVGMLSEDPRARVIIIPAREMIEVLTAMDRRGLTQVQWGEIRLRVFTEDVIDYCDPR